MKTIWFVYPYGLIPRENTQEIRYLRFGRELSKIYNCVWWTSNFSKRCGKRSESEIVVQDNLKIMLVPTTPYQKNISFSRVFFELHFSRNLRKLWNNVDKPDLIITPGTGMITAFRPVWPYIRNRNVKAVYDLMDVHPINSYMKSHHPFLYPVYRIFDWFNKKREKGFYKSAVGVTALGCKQLEIAKQRTGNRAIPSCLIYNSIYVNEFREAMSNTCSVELPEKSDWIWCVYAGSLNPSYDIPTVIECARKCEEENRRVLFIIVGGGEYADLCKKSISDHLLYLGFQDSKDLPPLYAKCDVGLCTYADFSTVDMPDKFYDYTAAGLAIVNSLKGESRDYVEGRRIGVQYKAGDPEDLYEKVCRFEDADYLADCKKSSWNIGEEFDFGKHVDKLKTLIDEII